MTPIEENFDLNEYQETASQASALRREGVANRDPKKLRQAADLYISIHLSGFAQLMIDLAREIEEDRRWYLQS